MPPPMTTALARSTRSELTPPTWSLFFGVGAGVPCLPALHRLGQERRQVDNFQLRPGLARAVVEHHGAERTSHRQGLCAGRGGFADAFLVDGTATALLH